MNYFVIAADGQKYGPVDLNGLNEWAQQNRVLPSSIVEDAATGARVQASTLSGLVFPPQADGGFLNPGGYASYPRANMAPDTGNSDMTLAWVMAGLSLGGSFCCMLIPLICGVIGIVAASNAKKKGHPKGGLAMTVVIVCLVVGLVWPIGIALAMGTFSPTRPPFK